MANDPPVLGRLLRKHGLLNGLYAIRRLPDDREVVVRDQDARHTLSPGFPSSQLQPYDRIERDAA